MRLMNLSVKAWWLLPIIIIVVGAWLTGCTSSNIRNVDGVEVCTLKLERSIGDYNIEILCIDKVQYIKVGTGLSPLIEGDGSTLPYIKECRCK